MHLLKAMGLTMEIVERQELQQNVTAKRSNGTKGKASKSYSRTIKRSSIFRGVTRHRWTSRYEAHLWDKDAWNHTQKKKGKQVYVGAYDEEEAAARAYDLAALKCWGPKTVLNFSVIDYEKDVEDMKYFSREEYLASLRRKSSGFSRGASKYRGVARHTHDGKWEARIGRLCGNKYLYLGTYSTEEEAAAAYDLAAIEYRGLNAITNFELSRYIRWLIPREATANDPEAGELSASNIRSEEYTPQSALHLQPLFRSNPDPPTQMIWPTNGCPDQAPYSLPDRSTASGSCQKLASSSSSSTVLNVSLHTTRLGHTLHKASADYTKSKPTLGNCTCLMSKHVGWASHDQDLHGRKRADHDQHNHLAMAIASTTES